MIMIRHVEGRRSERIAWLLEELGVPYELDYIAGEVLGSLLSLEQHHEMRPRGLLPACPRPPLPLDRVTGVMALAEPCDGW